MSQILHTISDERISELFDLLLSGENVTTLWLPGAGRTRFGLALQNREFLSEFIPDKTQKNSILFIYLDYTLGHDSLESQLKDVLSDYTHESGKREMLRDVLAQGYRIVLVLDNYTYLRPETSQFLFSVRSIDIDSITFMICQLESDFKESTSSGSQLESSSHAYHNVLRMPYMTREEAKLWIKVRARSMGMYVDALLVHQVLDFAGGIPVLIKNLLRGLKRYKDFNKAIQSIEIQNILSMFWSSFEPYEQELIKGIRYGTIDANNHDAQYLYEHNMADELGLIGTWLDQIIKGSGSTVLHIDGEIVFWGARMLSGELTSTEVDILKKLITDKTISRDDVADILWGDNRKEKYSDWAIDKSISRIRKKLTGLGVPKSYIKTQRGAGYTIAVKD